MTPDHYAVPDDVYLSLVGYVRWNWDNRGHNITTLWHDHFGRFFYHEEFWTPYSPPFWWGVATTDLKPCDTDLFCEHVDQNINSIQDPDEALSVYYRYRELLTVWGIVEGVDKGFEWLRENAKS